MKELEHISIIGLSALVFIVVGKLVFAKYHVPGVSDVFQMA